MSCFAIDSCAILCFCIFYLYVLYASDQSCHANNSSIAQLLRWKKELTEIYEKHTGQPLDKLKDDMERDKFMNAEEAVAYGLVDKIVSSRAEDNKGD